MSIILPHSNNLRVKTHGVSNGSDLVFVGEEEIDINDFFVMAYYVLTNTDLYRNDPRLKFIKRVKKIKKVKGYMLNKKHLE